MHARGIEAGYGLRSVADIAAAVALERGNRQKAGLPF
jgi:hypothetical protein